MPFPQVVALTTAIGFAALSAFELRSPVYRFLVAGLLLVGCTAKSAVRSDVKAPETASTAERMPATPRSMHRVKAHRGSSATAPENSLSAVALAFEQGADACEIDVRVTKDGKVVVFHDADTKRIGGRDALVADQTLEQLLELDIGDWKAPQYSGERILTLGQVIAIVPPEKTLFIEIKDGVSAVPLVLEAMGQASTKATLAVESFSEEVLAAVALKNPSVALHLTVGATDDGQGGAIPFAPEMASLVKKAGFHGLAVDARGMNLGFAKAVQAEGLELAVWTVNTAPLLEALLSMPVTYIETDRPAFVASILDKAAQ